ncbi:MOSC domain-containing protein [Salisediminibacterium beveridgei]|uniref:MOSC Domain-Containing Protein n=1 Tax=Salisediminibacterium beveridgei TaxID=632773 RepID=A0A1D7QVI0_9BACI|nr:MOSC domain-containing protein [Salisediminibacterium beveridgei]AOM83015.1 MOSC Domain-Containing Protein [Salisediminibacterium beveridgei]
MTGRVEAIWLKRMKQGPMDPVNSAEAIANQGLKGNANQRGKRQVTILEAENWEYATGQLNAELPPSKRRANILVRGISLKERRQSILMIGNVRIQIYGETKPCEQMEAAQSGLKEALNTEWRGGAYGVVLNDGRINQGDTVSFET